MCMKWVPVIAIIAVVSGIDGRADEGGYLSDIKPVLAHRCYSCHGALKQKAGLRLDTAAAIHRGSRSGAVLSFDDPDDSELLRRVLSADPDERMPPEGAPLEAEEIAALRSWIEAGAPKPEQEAREENPADHWAFQLPRRTVPSGTGLGQGQGQSQGNAIDQLLSKEQAGRGLVILPEAHPEVLLRRVFLDLIGLPPLPEDLARFQRDSSPRAYERLVERLLASPQYGERWGRHWMDIWRYSDWYGLGAQLRFSQKHLWHWRDWIVESLNEDKGYDQMVREMIAGDELAPSDSSALRATGFLARNYYLFNRNTWLEQTIEHTSRAFLGLTMQCAKCHDHKYDPISQEDYYRFRAFFEPHQVRLDPVPGTTDLEQDGLPRAFDAHPDLPTYLFERGNDKTPDTSRVLSAAVPDILAWEPLVVKEARLPVEAFFPGLQPFVLEDHLRDARRAIAQAEERLIALGSSDSVLKKKAYQWARDAAALMPAAYRTAHRADRVRYGLEEETDSGRVKREAVAAAQAFQRAQGQAEVAMKAFELAEGEEKKRKAFAKQLESAQASLAQLETRIAEGTISYDSLRPSRKALESPAETEESRRKPYPESTTGRRRALANWMVDRRNPLTARVAVNHIWLRHFGQPLVADVQDFGRRSAAPALQSILDYLAIYLMDNHWQMKPLHRLIVNSAAYRRSSSTVGVSSEQVARDPTNQFYWSRRPGRMESQTIRDSLRYLAGTLDLRMGGPTIDPEKGEDLGRRSLYFTHSRDQQNRFLSMFDDAEILACYRRTESIIPQQALALVNSKLSLQMADQVAMQVVAGLKAGETVSDETFARAAFGRILGGVATPAELALCCEMMQATRESLDGVDVSGLQSRRFRRNLVQALFNHNDFITIR